MGAFAVSQIGQNAEFIGTAQAAAYTIYEVIDRVPTIDIESDEGVKDIKLEGNVEFNDVKFTYPARKEQQVLSGVTFKADANQQTALCGQSGCGKSTCMALLQRFYDVDSGSILIDGRNIKDYNITWLRQQIGIVSQEPILFDMSIRDNIKLGRLDVTDAEITAALREANAEEFINRLPQKLDTHVGEGGATLSGGQKQRVAIARALVRNPKILLLDEATSALDTESEKLVQIALEKVSQGRTTIVIAHRLSTIKNSDKIIGFVTGKVAEEGHHANLSVKENGVYANLCNMQTFDREDGDAGQILGEVAVVAKVETDRSASTTVKKVSQTKKEEAKVEEEKVPEVGLMKIFALNKNEIGYNITGAIVAFLLGVL